MFARVARYEVAPERMDEAVEAFRDAVTEITGLDGLKGGSVLTDAEDGVIISLTYWESRTAMEDSEVKAAGLRRMKSASRRGSGTPTNGQKRRGASGRNGPSNWCRQSTSHPSC